ncbi:uncharacterized protein [Aristolochia californica]|uniref:uncharacterized protein isoform X1 n=1 Tax=Aristolochia californica TaxID=171875 RepID=UPI0035DEFE17
MATFPLSVVSCSAFCTTKVENRKSTGFAQILRKDREFIKNGFDKLKSTHLPALSKTVADILWLRGFESSQAVSERPLSWPSPSYPGLSGVDLMMADLEALKAYALYFYNVSKIWSKPLPEVYDVDKVADYFKGRPHVLALRVLEVLSSFASTAVKMRGLEILKVNRFRAERDSGKNHSNYYTGLLLKETLLNLGPTFIKVGQSLSTRPDIIGTEICEALSELHDQIPPFPRSVAMQIIEEEFGCPVQEVFSYISDEPIAAASFGQVYRGCTLDGQPVAIKVQRPNLLHAVIRDIYILRLGLGVLQKVAKRRSNLSLYADELGKGFTGELDYTIEAANASEFLEVHARFSFIYVPKIFGHLSRKKVLTMEWLNGENPNDLVLVSRGSGKCGVEYSESQQQEAKRSLLDMVSKGVQATLVQLLETGVLHADPHGGNLRYIPEGQIGFLDFGLLCRMERKHQFAMLASILHIVNSDWASLVYDLTEMDVVRPGTNLRLIALELENTLGSVALKDGIPDVKFSRVLGKIWSLALKYHFRMPPYYTLLLRSLASFEGLALAADPNFKTFQAAYPYVVQKLLTDNSPATRRILYSVVFNKRKEFQWQKLSVFLKVGTRRKGPRLIFMDNHSSPNFSTNEQVAVYEVADLILRLLTSKDGVILRRLLMTVDPASLIRSLISKEALSYRKYIRGALAGMLYQRMVQTVDRNKTSPPCDSPLQTYSIGYRGARPSSESTAPLYWDVFRDRRLKVIFSRVLNALRKDPILMFRFACTSFVVLISALAMSCHQFVVSWSEMYITNLSFPPRRYALNV